LSRIERVFFGIACALFGLCSGCSSPLDPTAQPFDPPAVYRQWFIELEACSGQHRDFDSIRWYTEPSIVRDGIERGGLWRSPNTIVIRTDRTSLKLLIQHEEMHYLLQARTHPPKYFNGVCGNLM
jgi:hypothetical protein